MSTSEASPSPCTTCTASQTILCHDILATIFDYLSPGRHELDDTEATTNLRQSRRQDLASSAVTCRILSHHALDVLWRELDDVYPLLKVLPNYKRIDLQVTFSGAILPEHWMRFELYADRVRGIGHPPREGIIHPSVWMLLAMSCRNLPLLPRLRKLVAPELRVSEISALFLLVSPTVRSIDVSLEREEQEEDLNIAPHVATSLIQSLPLMAPDLEDIKLRTSFDLDGGYLQSFQNFRRLRTLSIPTYTVLDEAMLQTLSITTSLEDLSCNIRLSRPPTLALPPNAFQRLTGLDITGHLDHLVAFIISCPLPNIARLVLQISSPASRDPRPVASFAAISQHCNRSSLTSFSVFPLCELTASGRDCLMEYFESFLAFPNISTFHFSSLATEPSISDDDLARFGAAWPRLTTFRAEQRWIFSSTHNAESPTLSGVIDLARRCPGLQELHLPKVDVRTLPKNLTGSLRHGLRSLAIQNIGVPLSPEEYSDVASVLDNVFPTMSLEHAPPEASRVKNGWKRILQRMQAMRCERGDSD